VLFNRKRYWPWILFAVLIFSAMTLSVVSAFPPNSSPWLTIKGTGDDTEAGQYYATIAAPATLSAWKTAYGFTGTNDTSAIYYNGGDLGFGREMHCRKNGLDVACYVVNHGLGAAAPADLSVNAAIANQNTLPVVAMVYKNALNGQPNDVSFYIYDQTGARVNKVALDSEGDKYVPYLCLPCHGGDYDSFTDSVSNANFLPFDVASFKYSQQAGYTLADQQEKFRQLNSMVRDTNPTALITELINGWYGAPNGVNTPGATPNTSFVPPGYVSDPGLYHNVVKLYCRSCHIAQSINLATPADVSSAQYAVFTGFYMPHAQLTNHNFWNSPAPAYLANDRGWSLRVTKVADTNDGACDSDCSLREAILAANASADTSIITFNVNGAFALSLSGADDTAALGDLDITQPLILLGNGASNTIISGNSIDRVFHILGATTNVVIQGVTIQDGNTSSYGGGILNDSSTLALNNSVVRNNTSSSSGGGGLASLGSAKTEINNSAIGPGNTTGVGGGGVYNDSQLILSNSTVSGNSAIAGGGLYSYSSGKVITVTQSTITGNTGTNGGGGIRNFQSTGSLQNSIVAGNSGGGGGPDCLNFNAMTSLGYNLVGQNGSANGCPATGTDIVLAGSINTVLNLSLSAVGADGTPHHALVQGGPAVDAIPPGSNCTLPSYDQRNQARPLDGNVTGVAACDIGAYEFNPQSLIFLPLVVKGP
jgi:CSLREA domain-containing protein